MTHTKKPSAHGKIASPGQGILAMSATAYL